MIMAIPHLGNMNDLFCYHRPMLSSAEHLGSGLSNIPRAQQERLAYIDFCAYFLGRLRRADVAQRFGTGPAAATRDIGLYKDLAPNNLELNTVEKAYRCGESFKPLFAHSVERVLTALSQGFGEGVFSGGQALVRCEIPHALSLPRLDVLAPISRAIHLGRAVQVTYYSVRSGQSERVLVPFALANNGARWHVRAFDRRRKAFLDFVLNRIEAPQLLEDSSVIPHERPEHDLEWSRMLELRLVVHPQHPRPEVVARDYEFVEGVLKVRVREAIAGYTLRQWAVDCSPDHSQNPEEFALWLPDSLSLYGSGSAKLAPGYVPPTVTPQVSALAASPQ